MKNLMAKVFSQISMVGCQIQNDRSNYVQFEQMKPARISCRPNSSAWLLSNIKVKGSIPRESKKCVP